MPEGIGPGTAMAAVFDALQADRRRLTIHELREYDLIAGPDEQVTVEVLELSKAVAAAERDVKQNEVSRDAYWSVNSSLRQTHLPKLAEYDIVEYDDKEQTVSPTDLTKQAGLFMVAIQSSLRRSGLADLKKGDGPW